jgi:hypothetical protein
LLTGHPHVAPRLYAHHRQTLLIDRTQNKLYCAPHQLVMAWLHQENDDPPAQIADLEQLADILTHNGVLGSWTTFHIDDVEIERRIAEIQHKLEEMHTWLNTNVPPPSIEALQTIQDNIDDRLRSVSNEE